jgi:hypothetical protein
MDVVWLDHWWHTVQWGNAPSWLSAIGTVLALGISLSLFRTQIMDRRRQQAERRIAQARLVSAWMEDVDLGSGPYPALVLAVRNGSDQAVYSVSLSAAVGVRGTFVRWLSSMGPGEEREVRVSLPAPPRSDETTPAILFTDSAGVQWLRTWAGELKNPISDDVRAHHTADPGAYDRDHHPTLDKAHELGESSGKRRHR